jgi:DNA-binding beta-propeller fold protein YncE
VTVSVLPALGPPDAAVAPDAAPVRDAAPSYPDTRPVLPDAAVPRDAAVPGQDPYIDVASQVERMKVDPKRRWLYALDSVNNSLHFANLDTNKIEKTIFVGSKPMDLDINQAGTELYIADFGATQITVVNLDTREVARTLMVDINGTNWDGNPYRLVCAAGGTVVFTSMDQWNDLKLIDATTGTRLAFTGSIYEPELVTSPDGTHVYMGESGLSTVTLVRYDVSGKTITEADNSGDAGSYGGRHLAITRDGKYLFFADKKILATNLKSVLGTFSEPIVTATTDGALATGVANIHDGNTFSVIGPLPVKTEIQALATDDSVVYLYDTTSSRIYIHPLKST